MAYTPAGRQQDNSILSQIMKYDKSVQPPQSYTNVSQQYTPFGRMEDWETLAKGLGKGIGVTAENIKEGAYKGTYDPREEGYKWAPGKLAAAGIGAGVAGIGGLIGKYKERKEWEANERRDRENEIAQQRADAEIKAHRQAQMDAERNRIEGRGQFMQGQELLGEEFSGEDASAAKRYYDKQQFEAQETEFEAEEAPRREKQVDPVTGAPPTFGPNLYNLPGAHIQSGTSSGLASGQVQMSGETLERGMEELRQNPSYLASLTPKERAGLTGELDPITGLPLSPAKLRKFKDPKFYNKWKMKLRRFLEKEFGKKAPVDLQSLTKAQQRLQQLRRKSKKTYKSQPTYPSGTITGGI